MKAISTAQPSTDTQWKEIPWYLLLLLCVTSDIAFLILELCAAIQITFVFRFSIWPCWFIPELSTNLLYNLSNTLRWRCEEDVVQSHELLSQASVSPCETAPVGVWVCSVSSCPDSSLNYPEGQFWGEPNDFAHAWPAERKASWVQSCTWKITTFRNPGGLSEAGKPHGTLLRASNALHTAVNWFT